MVSTGQDLTLYMGQDLNIVVTLAGETITGWTLGAYFRNSSTNAVVATKLSASSQITIQSATQCTIILTDADTDSWQAVPHTWSLWRLDAGSETPLSVGTITVRQTSREPLT